MGKHFGVKWAISPAQIMGKPQQNWAPFIFKLFLKAYDEFSYLQRKKYTLINTQSDLLCDVIESTSI